MVSLKARSNDLEIMDDLLCEGEVVHQTLRELEFINRWLGGNAITLSGLDYLLRSHSKSGAISVADLGCGGGDMLKLINAWGTKRNQTFELAGVDANPHIINFARRNCADQSQIKFECANVFSEKFASRKFDIVVATLFTHHFTHSELVTLLKQWKAQAQLGIVINDLHRHPLAYHSIRLLTRLFSKSAMVKFDAPLSVRRGFLKKEWKAILKESGIENYELKWRWAFRWQLVIPTAK